MLISYDLHHENCLDTINRIKQSNQGFQFPIDIVITSPPYNMNISIRKNPKTGLREYCSRQIVKEISTKYHGAFDDNLPIDEFYQFHSQVIRGLLDISQIIFYNIQIVTGSKRAFFKLIGDFSDHLKDIIIWDKGYAEPAMQNGVLNRQSELILIFESDKNQAISRQFDDKITKFKRGTLSDIWQIKRTKSSSKDKINHRARFPEQLVEKILNNFSNNGDVIYDPFMGSGTTGMVCKKSEKEYHFIGSEIIPEYFKHCEENIS